MSAHTPGPWEVRFPLNCAGRAAVFWHDRSKGGTHTRRIDDRGTLEPADAHLIAASPKLLQALCKVRDSETLCRENGESHLSDELLAEIDAAIAKATQA